MIFFKVKTQSIFKIVETFSTKLFSSLIVYCNYYLLFLRKEQKVKRIGFLFGALAIVFTLITYTAMNTSFASSCCGSKKATAADIANAKCVVCGKTNEPGKAVTVKCEEKSITLCCDGCASAFKKDPCKYCNDEKCEKHKGQHH